MKRILLYSVLLVCNLSISQEFKLGKVSIEELKETQHPKDTAAVAAILFKTGSVQFDYSQDKGFDLTSIIKIRIKIYKKEGYEYANYIQNFYKGSNAKETVSFSDAVTYNLVDGKIEKTKLKSDGMFEETINKYWGRKKISMPNVKEGSIIELECTIKSDRIRTIDEWEFQTDIPVNYSEFKTYIPEYFVYAPNQKGFIFPKVVVEKKDRKINYTYRSNASPGLGGNALSSKSNEELKFTETITTYIANDMPAMKDESYVNNIKNYTSSISLELSMIQYPQQVPEFFTTDWEKVVKTIYDSDDFGTELNKTGYFEEDLKVILKDITKRDEKIMAIFNFVKSKVKWNNYTGYSCDDGVKRAYKDGTGNVAEINLMLTAMLRFAGVSANPILLSTRSNGISYFPNLTAFNYVICGVEIENDLILLDATEKYAMPNILPLRDLNWFGRLIRNSGSSVQVDLTPKFISTDVVTIMATINTEGIVEGNAREQHLDYNALFFRQNYNNLSDDSYLEKLEKRHKNIEVGEFKINGKEELNAPIVENYSFKDNKDVEIIGDKMYFSPLLFLVQQENPFKQEKREYPVDFVFPSEDKYLVNLAIPDGYEVETIPQSTAFKTNDDALILKYAISNTGNKLQIVVTFNTNTAILPEASYEELKLFFEELVKKENEKVVLKKI